jgi:catechol 2,3-dioxygenase-like lactoylglutathione lyase family enzyme
MSEHPVPEMRLELVPVPVSDVDRAKAFYERIGFGNVHDNVVSDGMRVVVRSSNEAAIGDRRPGS